MNFGQLQADVASAIIDTPADTVAKIPGFVRKAITDIQDRHGFKVCETQSAIMQTTVNTRTLATVPSNLARYRKRPVMLENISGRVIELALSHNRDDIEREFGTAAGGEVDNAVIADRPRALLHGEPNDLGVASWEVYPLPDGRSTYANGEYRIRVPYYRYLPALVNAGDTHWFTENADQFIIFQAASYGFFDDHDNEKGTLWAQRARSEMDKAIDADKKLRLSSIHTLRTSPNARGRRFAHGDY